MPIQIIYKSFYLSHSSCVDTLDINYHFFEEPKEYLFFKKMGVSIFKDNREGHGAEELSPGLFLSVKSIAGTKRILVDTDFEIEATSSKGFLYSCSHSFEDIHQLKRKMDLDLEYRIYYCCHTFLDIRTEFENIRGAGIDLSRITFLVADYGQIPLLYTKKSVLNLFKDCLYNEVIVINPFRQARQKANQLSEKITFGINFFVLIRLLKMALMPGYFLKNQMDQLRVNNFVWLIRLDELIAFTFFIISAIWFKVVGISVDTFNFLFRHGKTASIKTGYGIRHLLLMSGFKSFGFFVDSYQIFRTFLIRLGFGVRHLALMVSFKTVGIFVDTFNFLFRIFKIGLIRIGYGIRHLLLMSGFKSFGFFVDSYQTVRTILIRLGYGVRHLISMATILLIRFGFAIRHYLIMAVIKTFYFFKDVLIMTVFHRYLLFPFYKVYWFLSFQYKKRIKKETP